MAKFKYKGYNVEITTGVRVEDDGEDIIPEYIVYIGKPGKEENDWHYPKYVFDNNMKNMEKHVKGAIDKGATEDAFLEY